LANKCPTCHSDNPNTLKFCGECGTQLPPPHGRPPAMTETLQAPVHELAMGSIFAGRYQIVEELGKGGMGTVYKVVDRKINEEMALKVLKPEIAPDTTAIERFKNELKLARRISHENVCRLYDLHEEAGTLFITMEYVPGEDLGTLLCREGRLPTEKACALAGQIAEGLAQAHRLGVIHRDLKPHNIRIDSEGSVRIMDFGIAREVTGPDLTAAGVMIGTPYYMSPEQAAGKSVDQRTDIYALGIILYELVTGQPPFQGESGFSVALKHQTEPPRHPRELSAQIPEPLDRLIVKCLAKKKEERYQSAEELLAELTALAKGKIASTAKIAGAKTAALSPAERECITSIAVLPFKDMSPQHDQEYLCEGLAEELINALAQVKGLKVAARTSAFSFKRKEADIREIGRQLNVGAILEGSIQKSGTHLRVTTQLICVSDGYHLWSNRFDRNIKDVFAVQDEISMAVVEKLKVELLEGEKERVAKRHTRNEKAYELYLKGRYHWMRRSPKDMILAVDCFQRAIDKDPRYALPYVGIADVFSILAEFGFISPREAYLKSRELLKHAQEIDDSLSELHYSLSLIAYCYEWDLPAAERLARRGIELNPQNMLAHSLRAEILGTWRRTEEALEEMEIVLELDPLSSLVQSQYGIVLAQMGRLQESRDKMLMALAMEPDNPMLNAWLGIIYLFKPANVEKSIEYSQKAADFGASAAYGYLGMAQAMAGRTEEALRCLEKLERIEKEPFIPLILKPLLFLKPGLRHFRTFKKKYVPAYLKAWIYLGLNRQEEALVQLEKSCQARDYLIPVSLGYLKSNDLPWIAEFTSSLRCQAIWAKIKRS
jgi:TolB-like protein/Tfp pilus assembly protein PilF/predicted Ser/Thr protein kinase